MLLFNFKLFQICSFPHFSPYMLWHIEFKFCISLCFYVPQSKFWVSSFCFNFCMSYASLWTKNTRNTQFSALFLRQFLWELCPFWNFEYWKYTVFGTFLLHPLTYWAESLHITLFFCTTDQVWVSSICELCLCSNLEYCKYSFLHFSLTRSDILSWNFAHDFVLLYYRSTLSVVNGYQFL